jgi:hypothetical protein
VLEVDVSAPGNRYEERKLAGLCTRCGEPATDDGQLCVACQAAYVRRKRRFNRGTRRARSAAGLCRECGEKMPCAVHAARAEISPRGLGNKLGNLIASLRARLSDAEPANVGNHVGNHGEDSVDLAIAARSVVAAIDGLNVARAAPAAQRQRAELAALSGVEVALQLGEEVLDRNGYVRARRAAVHGARAPIVHRDIKPSNSPKRATCAICGERDATTEESFEGRVVAACEPCAADVEVPDPPKGPDLRDRILAMLRRSDGMEVGEIAQALGEDDAMARGRISASLARAIKDGEVSCTGGRMSRTYHWVKR